ncbi:MAG: protein kinase [Proteobacteria bacterium]|nr:protein kinase [Pseudomonadota bacterium]MBU1738701.1 protein kinase [Pseudomonadota bacterium]
MKKISRFFTRFITPPERVGETAQPGIFPPSDDSSEPPSVSWKIGDTVLERYLISEKASGAMGHVFICEHLGWGIKMAIKAPRPELLEDSETAGRILKEADAWIRMGMHPNIATCYYVLSFNSIPHLFIEYVNGGSLNQWIQSGRLGDLRNILSLAVQFCHGMEFTHSKGIIHRDIKPQNILITQDSLLKITDFGIVLDLQRSGAAEEPLSKKTQPAISETTEGFRGTPGYASPEQFINTHLVDKRSDIYSFGLCLWMMLCGTKPFARNDIELPIPEPVSGNRNFELSVSLKNILKKCVAYDPEERFEDFSVLRQELTDVYSEFFRVPCPFARLDEIDLRAESLNNHAVSLFELHDIEGAGRYLHKALELNDNLIEAIYNLALYGWRNQKTAPSRLIRSLEAADKRLGSPKILSSLVSELKKWARSRGKGENPQFPEFKLCLPPNSTEVYRENQLFQSVRNTIESHLKNRRFPECAQTLITTWKSRYFIKDRFLSRTYENLLQQGTKGAIAGIQRLNTLPGSDAPVICLACVPGSRTIFFVTRDGSLLTWDLGRKTRKVVREKSSAICCMVLTPNGRHLVTGSANGEITLLPNESTAKEITIAHDSPIMAIAVDDISQNIAAACQNGAIHLYSIENGRPLKTFHQEQGVTSLLFLNDTSSLAAGSSNGTLSFWQPPFQQSTREISGHSAPVLSLSKNPGSRYFLSTGGDALLCTVETVTGRIIRSSELGERHPANTLLLDDNRNAITGGENDIIEVLDLKDGKSTFSLDARGDGICCLARGPRPHIFMAGCRNGKIVLVTLVNELSFP